MSRRLFDKHKLIENDLMTQTLTQRDYMTPDGTGYVWNASDVWYARHAGELPGTEKVFKSLKLAAQYAHSAPKEEL